MHSKLPVLEAAIAMNRITTVAATRTTGQICVSGPMSYAMRYVLLTIQAHDDDLINLGPFRLRRSD